MSVAGSRSSTPRRFDADGPPGWESGEHVLDAYIEFVAYREPFTFHDGDHKATVAVFLGDHAETSFYANRRSARRAADATYWEHHRLTAMLSLPDLVALREHDALFDCGEDEVEDELPHDPALEALGRRLHGVDPSLWFRLRRFGATPAVLASANAALFPVVARAQRDQCMGAIAPRRRGDIGRVRGGGRREHRAHQRRSTARAGPSDDPGEPEPGPAGRPLLLLVDPRFGPINGPMARALRRLA